MKKIVCMMGVVGALTLGACSDDTKKDLGLVKEAPDEFAVVTRAPLVVPPDYALRPPRPGAARPMEISTKDQARQTIFGVQDVDDSGVAKSQAVLKEDGFLGKLGLEKTDPNIRNTVDTETPEDTRTTAEKLLFLKSDKDALGSPIDPNEEFERLKEEGVVTIKKRNEAIEAP